MDDSPRIAELLAVCEIDARAVLVIERDGHGTVASLQAELQLSHGGAVAMAARLERERLVRRAPDPADPWGSRLSVSEGAALELLTARDPQLYDLYRTS
jgi:DNA-binding MarR family transcriptional regulator